MTPEQRAALNRAQARRQASQGPSQRDAYARALQARNLELSGGQVGDHRQADATALRDIARSEMSRGEAALHGFNQGTTLGFADEAAGALAGPDVQQEMRRRTEVARTAYPGTTTTAQIAGGVASPATALAPQVTSTRAALALGAGTGALAGAGEAEGGAAERLGGVAGGAASGLFFGGMMAGLTKGATSVVRTAFHKADQRPTLDTLRAAKNAAYAAVRRSGVDFDETEMIGLWNGLDDLARDPRWDLDPISEMDKGALAALRILQRRAQEGKPVSLNTLDKTRQRLWEFYRKDDHPFILEAVDAIDGLIAQKSQGNDVMLAAREANTRFKKAELLENAFRKARRQTDATGSGGNILNKYRQAVARVLDTPREAKYFSPEEIALMDRFVSGDDVENALRRAGKMAPGGNGLMTALNAYAIAVDPTMLAITGAATAAKSAADRSAMRGSEAVLDAVSTGIIAPPRPKPKLGQAAVGGAIGGNALLP